ncbi:U-box domain-containing protein 35-like [Phragmites australis]|uniref:U-box domain-containing protein 35-like n=1 Tax=Phragmites australis TaxID=29695 RepID=UPI002D77E964|nr:U-box domain-containing protein 35-like [Phragmites australis]
MSYPTFQTHPIVSPARKRDERKDAADAAVRLCTPLSSRERGAGKAAVAVDGDRGSQYALKWAADHILSRARSFFLLHVRRKPTSLHTPGGKQFSISHVQEDVAAAFHAQIDLQTKELLLPFQCFCSRRGLQCREIILDGTDVSKAIVDFVVSNNIDKLVLGAASRNAFTRTIRKLDAPTSVTKSAPNFCSVYVIAKGKLSSFRPATHTNVNDTGKEDLKPDLPGNRLPGVKSEPTPKLHNEGHNPSRPMPVHAAMPIDAISDESTEDGSLMSPDQQGHANYSHLQTASSCPSEFLSDIDKHGNYLYPEYPGCYRDILLLPNKDNEHARHAPHRKYLGFDESSFDDSTLRPGYNGYDPLSPTTSGEYTASTCHHLTEDDEAELRLFRIERKQNNGDMLPWNYTEEHKEMARNPESSYTNIPYRNRPEAEPGDDVPKQKVLTLDTLSSDTQHREGIIEEFKNHDSQDFIHPILRRLPPKFYSPRNDSKRGSAPEDIYKLELKCKALPRPIETKRMLECLPTRLECRIYTPDDIASATDRFSDELKVGEGGYGPVYKATLDSTLVAIKILRSNVTQGLKQFQQEVELLNNIRHPNMVHLVGACPEYGCLVYEYMPNGSLEDRLFCRSGTPPLPWRLRFKIALEIGSGLLYLHKMKPEAFVHRDLKPGNILLDADFVSKIGDVGLARIIPRSLDDAMTTQYRETAAAGTFCYIDPEYQKTGLVCTKSDVYALGVIYLQMITARDAMGLAYTVSDALEEGTFAQLLDSNVTGWPVQEAREFAELALKCCEMRRRDRPDLETVVLPELIRLHALVTPSTSEDSSSTAQVHQRSASEKDLPLDDDLVDILNDGNVKGASFAI